MYTLDLFGQSKPEKSLVQKLIILHLFFQKNNHKMLWPQIVMLDSKRESAQVYTILRSVYLTIVLFQRKFCYKFKLPELQYLKQKTSDKVFSTHSGTLRSSRRSSFSEFSLFTSFESSNWLLLYKK